MVRLSMPVRSFFSSRSFWKFSIFIMVPWSWSTNSEMSARDADMTEGEGYREQKEEVKGREVGVQASCTSAVPEVIMGGWVVLAQPLQDEFIVQQAMKRPEKEHVERQVANSLLLKVSTKSLHLPTGPEEMKNMFKTDNDPFFFNLPSFTHGDNR